jgi:hypothetical protein
MLPTDVLLDWKGRVVVDLYGYRIGRIVDVQSKPETDVPEWGCITFGRLSLRRRFVPLADAELLAGQVRVPHTKAMVKAHRPGHDRLVAARRGPSRSGTTTGSARNRRRNVP